MANFTNQSPSGLWVPPSVGGEGTLPVITSDQHQAQHQAHMERDWNMMLAEESRKQADFVAFIASAFKTMVTEGMGIGELLEKVVQDCPEIPKAVLDQMHQALLETSKKFLAQVAGLGVAWGQHALAWEVALGCRSESCATYCWVVSRRDRWESGGYAWRGADAGPHLVAPPQETPSSKRHLRPRSPASIKRTGSRMRKLVREQKTVPTRCPRGHLLQTPASKINKNCSECHRLNPSDVG